MSFCDLALECVTKLQPYVPGKPIEELERELGGKTPSYEDVNLLQMKIR